MQPQEHKQSQPPLNFLWVGSFLDSRFRHERSTVEIDNKSESGHFPLSMKRNWKRKHHLLLKIGAASDGWRNSGHLPDNLPRSIILAKTNIATTFQPRNTCSDLVCMTLCLALRWELDFDAAVWDAMIRFSTTVFYSHCLSRVSLLHLRIAFILRRKSSSWSRFWWITQALSRNIVNRPSPVMIKPQTTLWIELQKAGQTPVACDEICTRGPSREIIEFSNGQSREKLWMMKFLRNSLHACVVYLLFTLCSLGPPSI